MKTIVALYIAYILFILGLLIGWVMNLIEVINLGLSASPLTTEFIVRLIGVPVGPLGGIMGWF